MASANDLYPSRRPMKVVRVIARLNVGGPARHVVLLDRGLRARGHETLLVHGSIDPGEASLEHLAHTSHLRTLKIPDLGRSISPLSDIRAFLQLARTIFRETPDVVHTHTAKAGTLGRLAALAFNATRSRRGRCVLVHTFHGHVLSGYFGRVGNVLARLAERALGAVTDRTIAISPRQRHELVDRFRVASDARTVVVPLGLDLRPLLDQTVDAPNLRRELGIGDADIVVGYVGRFVPIKNIALLVRAFAAASAMPATMWLLLAGDGPLRAELESLADRCGVSDRVRFLGWMENLGALYATLDICALSSLNEGTPVAIIEAMAASKAVVATAVGGVADVVDEGRTGLLVESGDADALASALRRLAADPAERLAFGAAARREVARRFSSERLVDDIDQLYQEALAEKRSAEAFALL
ncbi:MAG TPA: glycosyltransferase [Vicinamibacterales bacterium]|nr:glycosyltransferase [Vicinamibacterales bacterium]